jgi:hypothetical protein
MDSEVLIILGHGRAMVATNTEKTHELGQVPSLLWAFVCSSVSAGQAPSSCESDIQWDSWSSWAA